MRIDGASETPPPDPRGSGRDWVVACLRIGVLWCVVSIVTLPLKGVLWLSELPLLAIPQIPKVTLANGLRTAVVMPAIRALGLSRGSFSPDYTLARPWALAAAYLLPLLVLLPAAWARRRRDTSAPAWAWILVTAAVIDFLCTLGFAGPPGLTLY